MNQPSEPRVHWSFDGGKPALETCARDKMAIVTTRKAKVTCPRCRETMLGEQGEQARRGRVREGYLTTAQLAKAIENATGPMAKASITIAYYVGLRASEVGLIRMEHLDRRRGMLDVQRRKGSTGGVYPVAPVKRTLDAWLAVRPTSEWLFPDARHPERPMSRFHFYRIWRAAAKAAGLPRGAWHPHVLKHSVATHMLERGDRIDHVQRWLGHKRTESTMVYAELTGRQREEGQGIAAALVAELDGGAR